MTFFHRIKSAISANESKIAKIVLADNWKMLIKTTCE